MIKNPFSKDSSLRSCGRKPFVPPKRGLICEHSIGRGSAFLDYAFYKHGAEFSFSASDAVGVVAALLAHGLDPDDAEQYLKGAFSPESIKQVIAAFKVFSGSESDHLWRQDGLAADDFAITHPSLVRAYPNMGIDR